MAEISLEEVHMIDKQEPELNVATGLAIILKGFMDDARISVKLSKEQLHILSVLLDVVPDFFVKLGQHVSKIASDKVIDLNDLPEFILLAVDIMNIDTKTFKKFKITKGDAVIAIETIITLLIEEDVIKTGNKKSECLTLLKISMKMISAKINLDKTVSCWRCF